MTAILPIKKNLTQVTTDEDNEVLVSYTTPVAAKLAGGRLIRTNRQYSNTTTRHINLWLGGRTAEEVDQSTLNALL